MRGMKYSPQTGMMYKNPAGCSPYHQYQVGPVINRDVHGYKRVVIKGKNWKQHRLAFMFMGLDVPPYIDHKDNDRNNNTWSNLTAISHEENSRKRKDNTSGVNGVSKHKDKWKAAYQHNKKQTYLGLFSTVEDAAQAIETFKQTLAL